MRARGKEDKENTRRWQPHAVRGGTLRVMGEMHA